MKEERGEEGRKEEGRGGEGRGEEEREEEGRGGKKRVGDKGGEYQCTVLRECRAVPCGGAFCSQMSNAFTESPLTVLRRIYTVQDAGREHNLG